MTIILKNVDSATLRAIESLQALNPKLTIKKESEKQKTKKPSKSLLKAIKEAEKIQTNPHLYSSYKNARELIEDCLK